MGTAATLRSEADDSRDDSFFAGHAMRRACLVITLYVLSGCGPDQAAQMLETARFEERQRNLPHAIQLYEDILRRYPESDAAHSARARLGELQTTHPGKNVP